MQTMVIVINFTDTSCDKWLNYSLRVSEYYNENKLIYLFVVFRYTVSPLIFLSMNYSINGPKKALLFRHPV